MMNVSMRTTVLAGFLVAAAIPPAGAAGSSVNVNVTNPAPIAVTGTVNANLLNTPLPVLAPAIPAGAFFGRIDGDSTNKATGARAGVIGLTSILIENATSATQEITFFNAVAADPTLCPSGTGTGIGGAFPYMYFTVEPSKTTQFTFPTPLVFQSVNTGGITCIAANAPPGVRIYMSGVSQ